MPVIPARLVRSNLNDPRKMPYLLVWADERHGGEIKQAVRLARYIEQSNSRTKDNYVELKRTDGSATVLRIVWRMLPRNGGRSLFLLCPFCNTPRRHVYGLEWESFSGWSNRVRQISWRCRSCARLHYSSEGSSLRPTSLGPALYQFLALVNAIRDGRARERNLAERDLVHRLNSIHGQP